jgi:hypothetical protein
MAFWDDINWGDVAHFGEKLLPIAGGGVGFLLGGPVGAAVGAAGGSALESMLPDPTSNNIADQLRNYSDPSKDPAYQEALARNEAVAKNGFTDADRAALAANYALANENATGQGGAALDAAGQRMYSGGTGGGSGVGTVAALQAGQNATNRAYMGSLSVGANAGNRQMQANQIAMDNATRLAASRNGYNLASAQQALNYYGARDASQRSAFSNLANVGAAALMGGAGGGGGAGAGAGAVNPNFNISKASGGLGIEGMPKPSWDSWGGSSPGYGYSPYAGG